MIVLMQDRFVICNDNQPLHLCNLYCYWYILSLLSLDSFLLDVNYRLFMAIY